jgi:hypothetical protein
MEYLVKILKILFIELKTNTGMVALLSSVITLALTKLADYLFVKKNAEMEIRKLLVGKSIEAHEEIIQYMNASRAVCSSELNCANRLPTAMNSIEQFDNFHLDIAKMRAVYSHLFDKKLVEEIDKLLDYSQTIIIISNRSDDFTDETIRKLGVELRPELFERLSNVQELAEKFLSQDVWKLKWNSYKTLPRPYYINDTP